VSGMGRREFVAFLGSAAAAWPLAALAQQPERMPRIGVLSNLTEDDPEARARDAAFVQGLRQLDWIDGRNVQIEYRYAAADPARFRSFAAELAGLRPNVVLAYTSRRWRRSNKRCRASRSYSHLSSIRSGLASSRHWPGPGETPLASSCSNTA
jgi:hypothetical protein